MQKRYLTSRVAHQARRIFQSTPVLVHNTIALVDGLQQQWLLHPERVSMVEEFGAYVAELRARWGTGSLGSLPRA